ncbi:MAG: hypothetical protein EOO24_32210, partial [Comamonadaceae bacterium]
MTTVTNTTSAAAAASAAAKASGYTSAADQQDRFMQLLVAQMTSQIAQINTVGGIEKLNTTVNSLLDAFSGMQAQSASQLAGRGVLVEGTQLDLTGEYAVGGVQVPSSADAVKVELLDASGQVARTIAMGASPAGARTFVWDGKLDDGSA